MHIFLIYGRDEHASLAERIKRDLEARGHKVWFGIDRFKPGGETGREACGLGLPRFDPERVGPGEREGVADAGGPRFAAVAVTPDGKRAVSASEDCALKVWVLETGMLVATLTCDGDALCCAFADDRTIVAGELSGRIHFLQL